MVRSPRSTCRAAFAIAVAIAIGISGCGDDQPSRDEGGVTAPAGFRVIAEEEVGLNGAENVDRPPITFLLLAAQDSSTASEDRLVEQYSKSLPGEGWTLVPHEESADWWTISGDKETGSIRIGPATRFADLATIDEGFSRTKFRDPINESSVPLIVVAIDPQG